MPFTSTTEIKSVTYKNWGYHLDNAYIANNGGFSGYDDYWQIKKPIDVSYEASVGGSFKIGGMTFFESERTNVNFYSSTSVDSSKKISTVRITTQNQTVSVPSNAKIMIICVRTISPNEEATVTITLRQKTIKWNTSDGTEPKSGALYDYDESVNYQIGKIYDYDGTTSYQIGKIYDYDGTTSSLVYSTDYELFPDQRAKLTTYTDGSGGTKTRTVGTTELIAQVSGGGSDSTLYRAGVRSAEKIDFSNYSKLIVVGSEISDTYGTWSGCDIAMSSSTSISGSSSSQSGANVSQSWAWQAGISKHNNTWNAFNKEFNISGVTGSYYLWFYAYSYHVRGAGIKCTSVILVE